jgi:putative thiamine transport system permease protein
VLLCLWSFADVWPFPEALPREMSLHGWQRHLPQLQRPFWNTLVIGIIATAIAIALALACLERETRVGDTGGNRALTVLYLPLIIPQAAFVFGLQLFFLFLGGGTGLAALVLAHLVFVLPYVFLSLSDPWRAFDPRLGAVAASLGAGQDRIFWRIRLPILLRPALVAAAVGFAVSIGQYLPTLLIGGGRWPTITTEAVALASGGDRRLIGIYALLQLALPLVGFAAAAVIPAVVFSNRRDMRPAAQ